MSSLAERTWVEVRYQDHDITADVREMVQGFEFCDAASGTADSLVIAISDPDGRWRGSWAPDSGAKLSATIVDQQADGALRRLPCGTFAVDGYDYDHLPDMITIRATSAAVTTAMRKEQHSARWAQVTLRELGGQLSVRHAVGFLYLGPDIPAFARLEQRNQSDLEFLTQVAASAGFGVRVDSGRIVVYHRATQDASAPVATYSPLPGDRTSVRALRGYRRCHVKFKHPDHGVIEAMYTPPNAPKVGQTLEVKGWVNNRAEAERLAQHTLDTKNREMEPASLVRPGDTRIVSGVMVALDAGYGVGSGIYAVESVRHTLWPYRITFDAVKVRAA